MSLRQEAQAMLVHILNTLCLRAQASPTFGQAVRAVIVLATRDASPRDVAAHGRAGMKVSLR